MGSFSKAISSIIFYILLRIHAIMDRLISFFHSIQPLSDTEQELMQELLYIEHIYKGERYCEQQRVCTRLGFVLQGVFKVVRTDANGDEFIQYFTSEGHFAVALESYSTQTLSEEYVEALTDCTVVTITRKAYERFEKEVVNFPAIISQIKEKALIEKYRIKSEMLTDDAQTRYNKLVQRQMSVVQRVPLHQIASFLGITQHTLSRLRAKK